MPMTVMTVMTVSFIDTLPRDFSVTTVITVMQAQLQDALLALPDEEILDYIRSGYDAAQIAMAMASDINLVALKVSELSRRGYTFRDMDHRSDFLK